MIPRVVRSALIVIETDGYCAPNPGGRATWAFVARDESDGRVLRRASGVAADSNGSNALAEWRAAFEALDWLSREAPALAARALEYRNDHAGLVRALAGESRVPAEPETRRLAQECRRLAADLRAAGWAVAFVRVPRWENREADALALAAHRAAGAGPDGST